MYALKKNKPDLEQPILNAEQNDLGGRSAKCFRTGHAPVHKHFSKQNFSPSEQEDRWIPNLE